MESKGISNDNPQALKSLIVVFSYHHGNTEKIAKACAEVLGAEVKTPQQVRPEQIKEYDLAGFGSVIYSATFGGPVLDLADRLPPAGTTKTFLFSTYGAPAGFVGREFVESNHSMVRKKLQGKGYEVIGEFGCAGWNTNSFLKYFGGLNKGRPNAEDLKNAGIFARQMMEKASE
jgi:flavodoxin